MAVAPGLPGPFPGCADVAVGATSVCMPMTVGVLVIIMFGLLLEGGRDAINGLVASVGCSVVVSSKPEAGGWTTMTMGSHVLTQVITVLVEEDSKPSAVDSA